MYKIGDKFEVVVAREKDHLVGVGDIVTLTTHKGSEYGGGFSTKDNKEFVADFEGVRVGVSRTVRPLRTEAEKRGAKFGVGGIVKELNKRIVFSYAGYKKNGTIEEEVWYILHEDFPDEIIEFKPSGIRLDHEPEYKEIPFSEGTHEQRMDARNLWYADSPVVQISHFAGSGYAFTYEGDFDIHTDANNLTIRIPT